MRFYGFTVIRFDGCMAIGVFQSDNPVLKLMQCSDLTTLKMDETGVCKSNVRNVNLKLNFVRRLTRP